jgi:coenzyme F420-reducing hydrogenase beta subunit
VGWAGFFQSMISNECRKIAYAASIARDDLSEHERDIMLPLIERFDAVSVREKTAKDFLERYSSGTLNVTEVLDPVLMLSKEDWSSVSDRSAESFDGRYAVAFFFSESIHYRRRISDYCKKHGLELKFIPFARGEYIASDKEGAADRLFDLGPYEFVKLFQNAQCVFTDSFHGAVFSVVFQKPFCVFERDRKSKVSKNSRLYDLLEKFELSHRLIHDMSVLESIMESPIDFTQVSKKHVQLQKESLHFLEKELAACTVKANAQIRHVGDLNKQACCGCELCAVQCPKKCIEMKHDEEGFCYPSINEAECVNCGRCLKICEQKKLKAVATENDTYLGFHGDKNVRAQSSSGGLFFALANEVLKNGGCVFGAGYAEDFSVKHLRITQTDELKHLMTSKYVQSRMQDPFHAVLEDLNNGRQVLFSGTPCQVAAMRSFIGQHPLQNNLLLVDFICHGVPSPGVWKSYIHFLETQYGKKLKSVSFRDKSKGWHDFHFRAGFECAELLESHELNAYMRSFLSNKTLRPSCYECQFKDENYFSDITLGDAWKIEKDYPQWADDKGISLFVARTDKGRAMMEQVKHSFTYRSASYNVWIQMNPSLVHSTDRPTGRTAFYQDFATMPNDQFWKAQKVIPLKKKVRYCLKRVSKVLGIEKFLRKLV